MRLTRGLTWLFVLAGLTAWSSGAWSNELKGSASPYLALHGDDPVEWRNWGENVMQAARRENKLVFLSIGYFSCHWCHVMQRESYRNPEIAAYLNAHFVPVKIDRELNPALDEAMMDFAETTLGRGGWPLNVFLTPEGYPVFATLYAPASDFFAILQRLQALWQTSQSKIASLARTALPHGDGPGEPKLDFDRAYALSINFNAIAKQTQDEMHGGFGESVKFPSSPQLLVLLNIYQRYDAQYQTAQLIANALDGMMNGGLRDHLRGGFFRYTVDPGWHTPHFEKMLYDNAQLALLYLRAGRILGHPEYLDVADETYDFMLQNMRGNGAFITALSAVDAEGREGGDYLWRSEDLRKAVNKEEYRLLEAIWGLTEPSSFADGGHLPVPRMTPDEAAKRLGIKPDQARLEYQSALDKLKKIAATRQPPRDDKLLAGWNGLTLASFAEAARLTGEDKYREAAQSIRDYLVNRLWRDDHLQRAVTQGKPLGETGLEDYGFVAWGLTQWAMLTREPADYAIAIKIAQRGYDLFYSDTGWQTGGGDWVKYRRSSDVITDGPMPSPAAMMLLSMVRLANETGDTKMWEQALAALNSGIDTLESSPFAYASTLDTLFIAAGLTATD